MIDNSCPQFKKSSSNAVGSRICEPSIEDSLVSDRIRFKQQLNIPLQCITHFAINIKPVAILLIKENFKFTRLSSKQPACRSTTNGLVLNNSFMTEQHSQQQKNRKVAKTDLCLSFSRFDLGICNLSFDSPSDLIRSPQTTTVSVFNLTIGVDSLLRAMSTAKLRRLASLFDAVRIGTGKNASFAEMERSDSKPNVFSSPPSRKRTYKNWLDLNRFAFFAVEEEKGQAEVRVEHCPARYL